jgi:hypothetical protein
LATLNTQRTFRALKKNMKTKQSPTKENNITFKVHSFFQEVPINKNNQMGYGEGTKKHIQNTINRPLTPQEKTQITKIVNKYRKDFLEKNYKEESEKIDTEQKERYKNNLLPLTISNKNGSPDNTYYIRANVYNWRDMDNKIHYYTQDESGYTTFKLRNKWKNTPVDKLTLDKYWGL